MARPGGDTASKARAAFIELVQKRERPTAAKIRAIIGGGGTDLIQRVIREMEDELYAKMFDLANRPDVPGEVVDSIVKIWEAANDLADQRYAAARAEYEQRVQAAEAAKEAAVERSEELAERVQSLDELVATKSGEASALRTALETAEGQIAGLQAQVVSKTEEADRTRLDAEARIQAATNRLAEQEQLAEDRYRGLERHLLENIDRERTQHGREIAGFRKEIDALIGQRNILEANNKEVVATIARLKDANTDLTAQLSEARGMLAAISNERDGLKRELAETRKKLATAEKQLESWKRRVRQEVKKTS